MKDTNRNILKIIQKRKKKENNQMQLYVIVSTNSVPSDDELNGTIVHVYSSYKELSETFNRWLDWFEQQNYTLKTKRDLSFDTETNIVDAYALFEKSKDDFVKIKCFDSHVDEP